MLESGAVSEADGRLIDSQGDRLIFPIINAMNEVIAFGGRKIEKVNFGKYKNTRDTIVFNKSKALYNINLLKKLKKTQTISNVIMVEGYMDTISLYKAGFTNVVASMGTSLTQDQARLLKRYSDNVLISYDGDAAGQKANDRGLDIFKSNGLNVKVVPLTDGLDPDDVINKLGADEYQRRLDAAMPLIDYKLKSAARPFDLSKTDDKRKYVAEAVKIIRTADSASEQEDLLKQLRDITGITYESLRRDVDSAPKESAAPPVKVVERKDASSVWERASRFVIAAYLFNSKVTAGIDVSDIDFADDVHTIIAKYIRTQTLLGERVSPAELLELFDEGTEEYAEINRIFDYSDGERLKGEVAEKYFNDCLKTLKLYHIDGEIAQLQAEITSETDVEKRKQLTTKLQKAISQKKKIKDGDNI
ncbi:MAG: toprim domain-containing protein [Clostridia bacterium]|nr:toprim domain-containing protein [Clostridia bacterium]